MKVKLDSQGPGAGRVWRTLQGCLLSMFLVPMLITGQAPLGSIEGRITRPDGRPARDVRVSAMTEAERNTPVSSGTNVLAGITETDAEGRYRLTGLPAGRYLVVAGLLDSPTYFPGATSLEAATMITLKAGAALRDISFPIQGLAGVVVSGRVIVPPGVSPATMSVEMSDDDVDDVSVSADGSFQFKRVPPGNYILSLETGDVTSNGEPAPLGIMVGDRDVTGLEFRVQPHVDVVGRIVVEGTGPRPQTDRIALSFATLQGGLFRDHAFWNVDGERFSTQLVEGEYRVSWQTPPFGFTVKSLTSGSIDLLTHPLKVSAGSQPQPIVLTLSPSPPAGPLQPIANVEMKIVVEEAGWRPSIGLRFAPFQGGGPYQGAFSVQDGEWWKAPLAEGSYRVTWEPLPPGYALKSLTSGSTDLLTHPLRVISGAQPEPVVITLKPSSPWPRISGRITGMRNIPAATITMTLVPSTSFRGSSYFLLDDPQVQVRSDGLFEFPRVPPGLYTVRTTPQWPVSPGAITVSDRNLTNLGLATSAAKEISGRVQLVSPPAEEIPLLFDLKGSGGTYRVSATMRLDGTFKTSFPEGEYHVSLITRGGLRPREMTYGGVNLMRERIKLRVNDRVEELRIRLTVPVTRVTGESALTSRCVSCPAPQFPSLASAARVTDTVKVSIVVGKDGTVTDASIISGHQLLRQAALDTVRKWRFLPETGNGAISIFFAYE